MTRVRDPARLGELLESATCTFMTLSYRRARMSELATAAGVAPGTLYLYFESKEALFLTVLQRAFLGKGFRPPAELPIPGPGPDAVLEFIRDRFADEAVIASLAAARQPGPHPDARSEVEGVVRELYRKIARLRFAVRVIERSASDWPELYDLHFTTMRRGLLGQLSSYLQHRIDGGFLRGVPDVPTAARAVLENLAWFAMHRHFSPDSAAITDAAAEETVVTLLVNALVPDDHKKESRP